MKPLLFIDVDGVLNRLVLGLPDIPEHLTYREVLHRESGGTFPLHMDRADADRLLSLTDVVDLAWGTTWEHEANETIGPWLGLPKLPVATRGEDFSKVPGMRRLAGNRPFAWLDDDIWAQDYRLLEQHPAKVLPVKVDEVTGLTDEHIAQVRQWAQSLRVEDRSEALARVLRDPDVYGPAVGTPIWPTHLAERIVADPGPLLAALTEAGVLSQEVRVDPTTSTDQARYVTTWTTLTKEDR